MADAAALLARLKAARPSTARFVDPETRQVCELPVDPALAARCRPETTWIPVTDSIAARIAQVLVLRDEDRVAVDDVISGMVSECAIQPVADDVLLHVLQHIADRGLTLVREPQHA